MKIRLVIIIVLLSIICDIYSQQINSINKLFEEFNSIDSPGVVAVLVQNGEIKHLNGYGNANLEYEIPITSKTIFHIGSVSKQFTAFAILLLENQGKLSLDDFIGKYLNDLPKFKNKIKIRHLLHHTSGLRELEKLQQIAGITSADQIESSFLYKLIKNQNDLNFEPGEELEYTNTNYFLLAKIVEYISGEKFRDWTKENIFLPLGMNNSQFYDDCSEIVKNRAYAYGDWDGELYKGILSYSYVGPTSVLTTGEDMCKWLINFSEIQLGNEAIIKKMLSATDTLNSGEHVDYGYGFGISNYKGLNIALHSGHDANYRAGVIYFPEHKTGIALLGNYYSISPYKYGFDMADIVLKDFIQEKKEEDLEPMKNEEVENYLLPYSQLIEFEGNYVSEELGVQYDLNITNDTLRASYWRNEEVLLTPADEDHFEGNQYWFNNIRFIRDDNNIIIGFKLSSGNVRNLIFTKV
ncbi:MULTISPECIES: serine hydrolase [unclassified Lentimicrobium]|uniref:serine hydrolase domain-containing protein n=1 Tax=unclassified Lentimicrobium TaxID=2677434 RepID=UPI001553D130|nr:MULTISPECIES: serine hydrolase domain-containing protein [unclassified Lentimicrobium]NPD44668.1 beta-lactamase family protein [Lentimicrobium sp. S6]NPD85848.1 beta-lactamase family protein [Lentimicrobium sp. L6]